MSLRQAIFLAPIALIFSLSSPLWAQTQNNTQVGSGNNNNQKSTAKLFGEMALLTNYVSYGITETMRDPAVQASFGYMSPQWKLGVWGSNVAYEENSENLNLRLLGNYKIEFSQSISLLGQYSFNRFYKSSNRNGTLLNFDLALYGYHVLIERNDNWEGTKTISQHFGFSMNWNLPWTLTGTLYAGYNMLAADGFSNYFDLRPSVSTKVWDVMCELAMTYNSQASQYNGNADIFWIFGITAHF